MQYILLLLLVSTSSALYTPRELIESDFTIFNDDDFTLKNYISNSSNSTNTNNPIIEKITSLQPSFGVSGMTITIYGSSFQAYEPYFINICNSDVITNCQGSCNYLKVLMPKKDQGICLVKLYESKLNFTYTIETEPIEVILNLDINLENDTEKSIFLNNFKLSLLDSMEEISDVDQIFICDTCIIKVQNRRLLNNQVKIIFTLVSKTPVLSNIAEWRDSQVNNLVNNLNAIVYNLQAYQNQTIILLSINNTSNIYTNNTNTIINNDQVNIPHLLLGEWEIKLIALGCCFGLSIIIISLYIYKKNRDQQNEKRKALTQVRTKEHVVEIDGQEIFVHEIQ